MKIRVSLALTFALAGCQDSAPPVPVVTPREVAVVTPPKTGKLTVIDMTGLFPRQQAGGVLLYDVRPGFVTGFGKIPGAVSWPRGDFDRRLSLSETEIRAARAAGKPVVIYCTDADCPDSREVAEKLAARGHDVSILEGGYADWKEAGLPTE